MTSLEKLAKMEKELYDMTLLMTDVVRDATQHRPGLSAALLLLEAQRTLCLAALTVHNATEALR